MSHDTTLLALSLIQTVALTQLLILPVLSSPFRIEMELCGEMGLGISEAKWGRGCGGAVGWGQGGLPELSSFYFYFCSVMETAPTFPLLGKVAGGIRSGPPLLLLLLPSKQKHFPCGMEECVRASRTLAKKRDVQTMLLMQKSDFAPERPVASFEILNLRSLLGGHLFSTMRAGFCKPCHYRLRCLPTATPTQIGHNCVVSQFSGGGGSAGARCFRGSAMHLCRCRLALLGKKSSRAAIVLSDFLPFI